MAEHASRRELRIWVEGRLSAHFADGVEGIEQHDDELGTVLCGDYRDEAHAHGVLEHLRGLGVTVRRFDITDERDRSEP
ncbi:MAG: hypothetical protein AAFZ07_00665 [Actinomycetota bacterium]